jgi:hypothetical protein
MRLNNFIVLYSNNEKNLSVEIIGGFFIPQFPIAGLRKNVTG